MKWSWHPLPTVIGLGELAWQLSLTQPLTSSGVVRAGCLQQPGDPSGGPGMAMDDRAVPGITLGWGSWLGNCH